MAVDGGIPKGSTHVPLLFLIYVNQMPSKVSNGCLLQFADDTCLICSAESPSAVAAMLQDDLNSLSKWIVMSKMRLNLKKSSVMWFSTKPSAAAVPRVMVGDTALSVVCKQKYLGVMFDSQLNWSHHVASVCKSMPYYLTLIGSHVRNLLSSIIKMLVECLVFSRYSYALPMWGSGGLQGLSILPGSFA